MLKEQFEERLPQIFEKLRTLDAEKLYEIVVRTTGNVTVKIPCREIFFAERRGRTTAIVTEKGIFEIREKIPDVMKLLPEDCFARCHNSIIVNMARVQEIYSGSLRMEDGTELLISRGHSRAFRLRYMNWAKSRML